MPSHPGPGAANSPPVVRIYRDFRWGWGSAGMFTNGAQLYDAWAELLRACP